MGSTKLIANLFRISQTEEKLRKDEIVGAKGATPTHYKVGKEQLARLQMKAKAGKLMLDE